MAFQWGPILVIAGNRYQFQDWLYRNNLDRAKYRFINDERNLYGIDRETPIILIGTYSNNRAYRSDIFRHRFTNVSQGDY